jgi:hypothetical protein
MEDSKYMRARMRMPIHLATLQLVTLELATLQLATITFRYPHTYISLPSHLATITFRHHYISPPLHFATITFRHHYISPCFGKKYKIIFKTKLYWTGNTTVCMFKFYFIVKQRFTVCTVLLCIDVASFRKVLFMVNFGQCKINLRLIYFHQNKYYRQIVQQEISLIRTKNLQSIEWKTRGAVHVQVPVQHKHWGKKIIKIKWMIQARVVT